MRKFIRAGLFVIFAGLFVFSGTQFFRYQRQEQQSTEAYDALQSAVVLPSSQSPASIAKPSSNANSQHTSDILWPEVDFTALEAINPQIVGWLYCAGTDINYPVVQGTDNDYYLNHLFDGTSNPNGCLFLDSRVSPDFTDVHSIIYGHHRQNDTMFSSLMGYKEQAYYDAHPQMLLVTRNARFVVELFSGYVADPDSTAWDISFADESTLQAWLNQAMEQSTFQSAVQPSAQTPILTLSTCSYEFEDARFVVAGILHRYDSV